MTIRSDSPPPAPLLPPSFGSTVSTELSSPSKTIPSKKESSTKLYQFATLIGVVSLASALLYSYRDNIATTLDNFDNAFNNRELAAKIRSSCISGTSYTSYQPILDSLNGAVKGAIHASIQNGNGKAYNKQLDESIRFFKFRFKKLQQAVYDNQQMHQLCTSQYQDYAALTCPLNRIGTWLHLNSPDPLCDYPSEIQKFYEDTLPPFFDPILSFNMQKTTVNVDLINPSSM